MNRLVTLALGLTLASCGLVEEKEEEKTGKVTPELKRIQSSASLTYYDLQNNQDAGGIKVSSDINIESLKVPIFDITLSGSDRTGQIYTCKAGTNDGCLVELTGTALSNLIDADAVSIEEGTYDSVTIGTCRSDGYEAKITASGQIPGSEETYYTQAGESALSTSISNKGEATVYFSGCSRVYPLPSPITISEGDAVSVKLYFDITDIAFFGDGTNDSNSGKAVYAGGSSYPYNPNSTPNTTFVGVNYLDVAGTIDTGSPSIKRFRITSTKNQTTVTQATVGFFYNSKNKYFGGYTRSYYSSTSTDGHNSFVTPVRVFENNGNDTYKVENYGESSTSSYVKFSAFEMSDHTGTCTIQGSSATYSAEEI